MQKMIFVSLPAKDLDASTRFYQEMGCVRNDQFSTDQAAMMAWSETISFMLLTHDYFSTFTSLPIADAKATCQVLLALSRESREAVDAITEMAARHGGTADVRPPQDYGFMYTRAFADPDGHIFEAVWMDMEAAAAAPAQ